MPFMSMTNLLTALLNELKHEYVTEQTPKHKKMRSRIKQTLDLISSFSEISSLVIKGNPFKRKLKPGASGTSSKTGYQAGSSSSNQVRAQVSVNSTNA